VNFIFLLLIEKVIIPPAWKVMPSVPPQKKEITLYRALLDLKRKFISKLVC